MIYPYPQGQPQSYPPNPPLKQAPSLAPAWFPPFSYVGIPPPMQPVGPNTPQQHQQQQQQPHLQQQQQQQNVAYPQLRFNTDASSSSFSLGSQGTFPEMWTYAQSINSLGSIPSSMPANLPPHLWSVPVLNSTSAVPNQPISQAMSAQQQASSSVAVNPFAEIAGVPAAKSDSV